MQMPPKPEALIIKEVIECYEKDHSWYFTKMCKLYYIKNIMGFASYYFQSKIDPWEWEYGPASFEHNEDLRDGATPW